MNQFFLKNFGKLKHYDKVLSRLIDRAL